MLKAEESINSSNNTYLKIFVHHKMVKTK